MGSTQPNYKLGMHDISQREVDLVENCVDYAGNNPAGLPGHNLMILVAKLATHYDFPFDLVLEEEEEWK